jgi:[ribosomal protein S5]-alanine N-acetyltransferase
MREVDGNFDSAVRLEQTMQATTWETQRLRCRPIAQGDLASLVQLYRDPTVVRYLGTGQPLSGAQTAERLQNYLEAWAQAGFGSYALVLKTTAGFIGCGGIEPCSSAEGLEGEIGWVLAPPYWGQGLATEFARAMITIGFERFSLKRIFARADLRNGASIHVMQKAGLTLVRSDEHAVEYAMVRPQG